jgi:hypothetical protein
MASSSAEQDKYRNYLSEEETKNTQWRFGLPDYSVVNKLFEEGRTKVSLLYLLSSVCVCVCVCLSLSLSLSLYIYIYIYIYISV